ncbi:hypothetical protein [Adlercreutzia faecimuris]|uniref:Zinc ribbon domain-containing protein n=1 Tax=Adlercreutzia faecimuris TaxID=2897341 RepID=A0ABS9WGB7_9ACTN|nr:hypothetical protein [Adlercreutzia sp. JBNU-10]MCI2241357.1 hypothetical protein [Adlercreutzia sp. JBNU-10]
MCFRPAEAELPPVLCPSCGKKINRIGGALPSKCPFCKTSTEGIEDAAAPAAPAAAPSAPAAPGAPKPPSAPAAPAAPKE